MIQKAYAKKLASLGFSLIPCNEKKHPMKVHGLLNQLKNLMK